MLRWLSSVMHRMIHTMIQGQKKMVMQQLMTIFGDRRNAELASTPLPQRQADAKARAVRAETAVATARASHAQAALALQKWSEEAEDANTALAVVNAEIAAELAQQPALLQPGEAAAAAQE